MTPYECFRDFIGLRGCNIAAPESGLYINSLAGISMQSIDSIAKPDQVTYINVWSDVQERALRKFGLDVINAFKEKFKIKTIQRSVDLGRVIDTTATTAANADYRGVYFNIDNTNDSYNYYSSMQVMYVESVSVYLSAVPAGNLILKVVDIATGELLDTITTTHALLTTGWNTVTVNEKYETKQLFIGYDSTQITSVELLVNEFASDSFCGCCQAVYGCDCCGAYYGAISDDLTSVTTGTNTFGLTAKISVQCSYGSLICQNRQLFATCLWYLMGSEICTERIYSQRNNYFTFTNEEAEKMRTEYFAIYENELKTAVGAIQLDPNDCCLECNQEVTYKEIAL